MALPKIITKVNSGGAIGAIKANPATNRIYVSYPDPDVGAVGVLDAATNRIVSRIKVGRLPFNLEINPRTNRVYAANFRDKSISVINGRTIRVIKTVKVGSYPDSIGVDMNKNLVYVPCASGILYVLNGKTNRILTTIRLGGRPSEIAINERTNHVYVTNTGKNNVSIIDGIKLTVIATIKVGKNPVIPPVINTSTNCIYVANNLSRFLSVIDGRANKLCKNIQLGRLQSDIIVNSHTNRIYVSSAQVEGPGKLFVINGSTNKIITTMVLPTFSNLFLNPLTNHLFISDFDVNRLYVYNARTLKRIAVFASAAGNFAFNPITNRLFVGGDRSIIVIQDAV